MSARYSSCASRGARRRRCRGRFGLWGVVTGRGQAASKAGPAPNPVPTCRTARQLPSRHHPTAGRSSDVDVARAATLWLIPSRAPPAPTALPPINSPQKNLASSSSLLFSILNNANKPHSRNCFLVGWEVRRASSGGVRLWPTIMPMRFSNGMENEHQRTILGAAAPLLCPMGVAAMIERTDVHACTCVILR